MGSAEAIATLVEVIDRVVMYLRGRQKQHAHTFEADIQPLFEDMMAVHDDYREAFQYILSESYEAPKAGLIDLLREKKWRLQPLRDKINALLPHFTAREDESAPFYEACSVYFLPPSEKGRRSQFRSAIELLLNSRIHPRDVLYQEYILSVLHSCEIRWKRITEEYAKLVVSRSI